MEITSLFKPFFQKAGKIFLLILGFTLSKIFIDKGINLFFLNIEKKTLFPQKQRLKTLKSLLKNIIHTILFFVVGVLIIQEFGFNIAPFITGAGILGLAFSFGAQTLVKDLIAGFFIILENQFNVGDEVQLNSEKGVVHKITMRSTILKDEKGNFIHLPNSAITKIVVFNKNNPSQNPTAKRSESERGRRSGGRLRKNQNS